MTKNPSPRDPQMGIVVSGRLFGWLFLFLGGFLPDPLTLNKAFLLTSFMAIYLQTQALGHCHLHVLVSSVCLKQ